jgi:hypothetical protein
MSVPGEWFRRARYLLNRRRIEDDLRREMEAQREMMPAPARFGNTLLLREEAQEVWGWRWLDDLVQDARYAVRTLAVSHRTFAVTGVLMLAAGIGVTTAVFSVVSGMMLRPLPFARPDRLVKIHGTGPGAPEWQAVRNYDTLRRESTSFDGWMAYEVGARYLRDASGNERVMTVRTEGPFFAVLGVPALYGRTYEVADGAKVAVVSEMFWRRRLGGNPAIVGQTLMLDGQSLTIAGIMPDWFQYPYTAGSLLKGVTGQTRTDVWLPFDQPLRPRQRMGSVTARLEPGVSLAAAQAELNAIARRLEAADPQGNTARGIAPVPLAQEVVPIAIRRLLFLLFGAIGVVLVLACANVANLALARMTFRRREVAVRAAIGASPSRLVRQFLAESLLLALTGGLAGLLLAWWVLKRLVASASPYLPRVHEVGLDWRVFGFKLGVCVLVGTAVGAAPAIIAARRDPRGPLQDAGGHGTMGPAQRRLRNGLVIAEVALAFVLGAGASVLLRELVRLRATDAGPFRRTSSRFRRGRRNARSRAGLRHRGPRRRDPRRAGRRLRADAAASELGLDQQLDRLQGPRPARQSHGVRHRAALRDAGLLRGARHPDPARPRLHEVRRARRAARDHHQRRAGAARVPRGGSDRAAHHARDDRRRHRGRAPGASRSARGAGGLLSGCAELFAGVRARDDAGGARARAAGAAD